MEPESDRELKSDNCQVNVKNPKRILHFSDGTLEEYSDSEQQDEEIIPKTEDVVDTTTMGWGPWLLYKAVRTGSNTLAACDYVGEALASFLGITTPKYQYELDEYIRLERERKALSADKDNANGWLNAKLDNDANSTDNGVDYNMGLFRTDPNCSTKQP